MFIGRCMLLSSVPISRQNSKLCAAPSVGTKHKARRTRCKVWKTHASCDVNKTMTSAVCWCTYTACTESPSSTTLLQAWISLFVFSSALVFDRHPCCDITGRLTSAQGTMLTHVFPDPVGLLTAISVVTSIVCLDPLETPFNQLQLVETLGRIFDKKQVHAFFGETHAKIKLFASLKNCNTFIRRSEGTICEGVPCYIGNLNVCIFYHRSSITMQG